MLAVFVFCAAGCAGVHQSGSVSPASFFLPGIMKADPPKSVHPELAPAAANEYAFVQ